MDFTKFNYKSVEEIQIELKKLGLSLSTSDNFESLRKPLVLRNKKIANRICYHPMEGCDGELDGSLGELTIRRYLRYADGAPGIVWFEAVAIEHEGRANPRQLYLFDKNLDSFKSIVHKIKDICMKKNGFEPLIIMQATHSGRYSKPDGVLMPIIAYNNPIFEKENPIPKERIISDDGLRKLEEKMAYSAQLAVKAGFDGIDVKACHRYINSELLSAFTRDGQYGGSFENRTRFFLNSVKNIDSVIPKDFLISSRMNAYDGFPYPYGFGVKENSQDVNLEEAIKVIALLQENGVELLNITMGNPYVNPHVNRPYDSGGYTPPEHPFIGVARLLNGIGELQRKFPNMHLVSTGYSYLREFAPYFGAAHVENGESSFMGIGRMNFAYPDFARDVIYNNCCKKGKACITCSKCTQIMRAGGTPGCLIRDAEVYLPVYKKYCAEV